MLSRRPQVGLLVVALIAAQTAAQTARAQDEPVSSGPSKGSKSDVRVVTSQKCQPLPHDAIVNLDFKGDVVQLISTISEMTCKNFIITSKVKSQVFEIRSATRVSMDDAWGAFLSALEANEFLLLQVGKYYKIEPANDSKSEAVDMYGPDERYPVEDHMVTRLYKPKNPSLIDPLVFYLNIFKSTKGHVNQYPATNTVFITDWGTAIKRMEDILGALDEPTALEQLHVVPIKFANSKEVADKLTQVFEPSKAPPTAGAPAEGASKIVSDDRTNQLIIVAFTPQYKKIMSLLKELDVPALEGNNEIQIVRLQHAAADELATTLTAIAQGKAATKAAKNKKPVPGRPAAEKIPGQPVNPVQAQAAAHLVQGDVKITADKPTNSLLISASKNDYVTLKQVIQKLDVARYQVLVEAVIMEVAVKRDRQLGFTWHGGISPMIDGRPSPIIFGNQPTQNFSSIGFSLNPLALASILGFGATVRGPTLEGSETLISGGIPSIGIVVQALQTSNDINVISTPHILTLDNEEAELQVNEKRPFPSGISLGGLGNLGALGGAQGGAQQGLGALGGLGLGSLSFNREDVGLTLKLKPQISDEDYVRLEIDQELSDVAGVDAATNQTITSKRAAKTVSVVRNQDSVVIGGLVRDRETIDESKIPLFGDLPLIGWLFKRQIKTVEKVNLLLILTPYIIRGPDDFRQIFERKMEERRDFVNQFYAATSPFEKEIDWTQKKGPIANYRMNMRNELHKAENEGPGEREETIVSPDEIREGGTENHLPDESPPEDPDAP